MVERLPIVCHSFLLVMVLAQQVEYILLFIPFHVEFLMSTFCLGSFKLKQHLVVGERIENSAGHLVKLNLNFVNGPAHLKLQLQYLIVVVIGIAFVH
jgi:hypothetical protein